MVLYIFFFMVDPKNSFQVNIPPWSLCDREVLTKDKNEVKEKNVQTEIEDPCVCKEKCNSYKVPFEKDKVICILKRAKCSVERNGKNMRNKLNQKWK